MSRRTRLIAFGVVVLVAAGVVAAYAVRESRRYQEQRETAPSAPQTPASALLQGSRILFRHTGLDNRYGLVAMVALDDPGGPRAFTDVPCDRVDATADLASCLVTQRGVVTKFRAQLYDPAWQLTDESPLEGIPSRTRLSPDGTLVATTSFVTGHSYMTSGFATATEIRGVDGTDLGNLEDFALEIDGRPASPVDRNFWGVTFVDDEQFYATLETGDRTYLVEGSLADRTLTTVTENAECPSVSPDGSRVAFKVDRDPGDQKLWGLAVLDLATGTRTELSEGTEGLDDQVEWLDDDTLLYGLPRAKQPGVDDVWAVDTTATARPRLLIEQAWSPTVVRTVTPGGEQ